MTKHTVEDRINVADCYHYNGEANAARIVKCVNLHDELVMGIENALRELTNDSPLLFKEELINALQLTLAKARN